MVLLTFGTVRFALGLGEWDMRFKSWVSGEGRETARSLLQSPGENRGSPPGAGEDRAEVPRPSWLRVELTGGDFDFL